MLSWVSFFVSGTEKMRRMKEWLRWRCHDDAYWFFFFFFFLLRHKARKSPHQLRWRPQVMWLWWAHPSFARAVRAVRRRNSRGCDAEGAFWTSALFGERPALRRGGEQASSVIWSSHAGPSAGSPAAPVKSPLVSISGTCWITRGSSRFDSIWFHHNKSGGGNGKTWRCQWTVGETGGPMFARCQPESSTEQTQSDLQVYVWDRVLTHIYSQCGLKLE